MKLLYSNRRKEYSEDFYGAVLKRNVFCKGLFITCIRLGNARRYWNRGCICRECGKKFSDLCRARCQSDASDATGGCSTKRWKAVITRKTQKKETGKVFRPAFHAPFKSRTLSSQQGVATVPISDMWVGLLAATLPSSKLQQTDRTSQKSQNSPKLQIYVSELPLIFRF
jgi:hypothetical protein